MCWIVFVMMKGYVGELNAVLIPILLASIIVCIHIVAVGCKGTALSNQKFEL